MSPVVSNGLSSLLDGVLGSIADRGLLDLDLVLVLLHELGQIELWLLQDLDLPDHAVVLQWEDFAALSLNLLSDFVFNTIKY